MSETLNPHSGIQELQDARHVLAERLAVNRLILVANYGTEVNAVVGNARNSGIGYDSRILTSQDLMGFDALGIDPNRIASQTGNHAAGDSKPIYTGEFGGDELIIEPFSEGVTVRLKPGNEQSHADLQKSAYINGKIAERVQASPAHQVLSEAINQAKSNRETSLKTVPFNGFEDPIGTLTVLGNLNLLSQYSLARGMRSGMSATEVLKSEVENAARNAKNSSVTDEAYEYTVESSDLTRTLSIDKETGYFRIKVDADPDAFYEETASTSEAKSIPFVETDCARDLIDVLDQADLMFHPKFTAMILLTDSADTRYGGVYTEISRELAKMVNRPDRAKVSSIFVPKNEGFAPSKLVESSYYDATFIKHEYDEYESKVREEGVDIEQESRVKLSGVNFDNTGDAASTILNLLNQVANREVSGTLNSGLPVSDQDISMRDGSCFDVFNYYLGAVSDTRPNREGLTRVNVDGVEMLEKTFGKHTFLATMPFKFNGINLPKGSLMARDGEGNWVFTRVTPFTFDKPEDQIAMGSEVEAAYVLQRETIARIGGTTINNLISSTN
jgi:hypothetical protein